MSPILKNIFLWAGLALALIVGIGSLQPGLPATAFSLHDKVEHFVAYGAIAGLLALGRPAASAKSIFLAVGLYGTAIEVLQHVIPSLGRTGSIWDAVANLAGIGAAVCIARVINRHWR